MIAGDLAAVSEAEKLARMARTILVVRGTGVACAGLVASCDLCTTGDKALPWAAAALTLGATLALCAPTTSVVSLGQRRRRGFATAAVILWTLAVLTPLLALLGKDLSRFDPFHLTGDPLWFGILPALFLPEVFALWVFYRRPANEDLSAEEAARVKPGNLPGSGRILVAYGMCVLATVSSVMVAWLGPAVFLA